MSESGAHSAVCGQEALDLLNCVTQTPYDQEKCVKLLQSLRDCVLNKNELCSRKVEELETLQRNELFQYPDPKINSENGLIQIVSTMMLINEKNVVDQFQSLMAKVKKFSLAEQEAPAAAAASPSAKKA